MKRLISDGRCPGLIRIFAVMVAACATLDVAHAGGLAAEAASAAPTGAVEVAGWGAAISNRRLANLHGGFDLGPGLLASFGIERAVYVNGNLVTSVSLYIPNIGQLSAAQATALAAMAGTVNGVGNGSGNSLDPAAFAQTAAATVVQNTMNNQRIQTLTTLNTTVNTLDAFRGLNLQSSLQSALINSLGH